MGVLQVSAGARKVQCGEECKSIASQINYEAIAGKFSTGKEVSTLQEVDAGALSRISRDFE